MKLSCNLVRHGESTNHVVRNGGHATYAKIMEECVSDGGRPRAHNPDRQRYFTFRGLLECRAAYSEFVHADDIEWEPADEIGAGSKDTDAKPDADAEG